MANRRELLQSGLVVSALAALPTAIVRATPGAVGSSTPTANSKGVDDDHAQRAAELFVYDERFPDALAAARDARHVNRDVRIASSTEVLTHLWYHELDARWRRAQMTFAGLTTERTLFVLETLALDRGMRVVQRTASGASGAITANETLVRWLIAPKTQNTSGHPANHSRNETRSPDRAEQGA